MELHVRSALRRRPWPTVAAAILSVSAASAWTQPRPSSARVLLKQPLPVLDGAHLSVQTVEVVYEPGGANVAHRHPCPVVGYVLEGALRMAIDGQPAVTHRAGDTFIERPADVHRVSANASQSEPARFLAYFICDRDVAALSVPVAPEAW